MYIKADTLEELDDITKKVRADLESGELKIRSKSIPNMNQNYYRKIHHYLLETTYPKMKIF